MVDILRTIEQAMESRGFKRCGDGFHSTAYRCRNPRFTVKFFDGDPGYLYFLRLIQKHPNNPHFPRIICCRQLPRFPGVWMVKQETLDPVSQSEWREMGLYYFNQHWINLKLLCFINLCAKQKRAARRWLNKPEEQSMLQALYVLIESDRANRLDVKRENVMKRGDVYVFIDPFW